MNINIPAVRVLLADDQTLFRVGLSTLLGDDPRIEIVGQAASGAEAVELTARVRPDVVLMDIRMPEMDGIEATRRIVAAGSGARVLVLTAFELDSHVVQALKAGASGYVLKDSTSDAIASSVMTVMAGERVMASAVANRVLEMLTGTAAPTSLYDGMTAREIEVLCLLAAGTPNKGIAYQLTISEKTVRNHVSSMYQKLHISDRSQAVLYAVRKGLVEV